MPTRELSVYVEALPEVMAGRSLAAVSETAAGTGAMKQADRDQLIASWRRAMRGQLKAQRVKGAQQLASLTAATGIGFRTRSVKKGPDAGRA